MMSARLIVAQNGGPPDRNQPYDCSGQWNPNGLLSRETRAALLASVRGQ